MPTTPAGGPGRINIPSRTEKAQITLAPDAVLKPGAIALQGTTLKLQNQELANLIHSKLAASAALVAAHPGAADADVSVGVKVKF